MPRPPAPRRLTITPWRVYGEDVLRPNCHRMVRVAVLTA